ncbi:hypothetical protein Desfe_0947 [Desulfurococcus amylolyticus DSM 16532]|uniref:Uncharacterized protein n=2 Tax=Desulfurococcus amylolyticus TaxID=94694 RepID=I3XSA9_DESAM|nr:hypothetical protein Desfe_0947 [Desulfurococcus amylolyticus DSM 16532]
MDEDALPHVIDERLEPLADPQDVYMVMVCKVIIRIRRTRERAFDVTILSEYGYPFETYKNVIAYIEDSVVANIDELFIEALMVKYEKERGEVRIYVTHRKL